MKLGYNLTLEQSQKLVMTPELRQAIQLLQYNSLELNQYIDQEMQENPMLELETGKQETEVQEETHIEEEVDWKEYIENYNSPDYRPEVDRNQDEQNFESFISHNPSLIEHLMSQLGLITMTKKEYKIGEYIVQDIDVNGYLKSTLDEIAISTGATMEETEKMLKLVQSFDPLGVGARDLRECLLIQIKEDPNSSSIVETIITDYIEDLGHNRLMKISKELDIDILKVQAASDYIKTLEPKPGRSFSGNIDEVKYIVPDATLKIVDGEFVITINDVTGPRLNISHFYQKLLRDSNDEETTEFLTERLNSALWIIRSIDQRRQTILKVIESILKFQKDFFKNGDESLVPLTLKDIAEDIDMHESTVSRATKEKYLQTPKGLFELKYFFTTALSTEGEDVSSKSIKSIILDIIENEDPKKPLSDQRITDMLKERGAKISRRTVAKYRDELDIPSSTMRRRF